MDTVTISLFLGGAGLLLHFTRWLDERLRVEVTAEANVPFEDQEFVMLSTN